MFLRCYYFVFQTVGVWEKVFPFSTQISWHSAIFFPSYGKSHSREKIYMTTTYSYFEMTNTMMKQKKFPIKINHMSAFSSGSARSQLRKYALAVDHGVNTYLLCLEWPIEKQTEIWANTDYENKKKSTPRAGNPMLLPVQPWKNEMHTTPCLWQCLIILYQNKLWNSRPNIPSECWTSCCLRYSLSLDTKSLKNWKLTAWSRKIQCISFAIDNRFLRTSIYPIKIVKSKSGK